MTPNTKQSALLKLLACMGILTLCGCLTTPIDYTVTIEYEESAVFSLFKAPAAPGGVPITVAAGQGLFVDFKIVSIQNLASGAKDFTFDPTKLFVNTTPRTKRAGGGLAPFSTAQKRTVQKGTIAPSIGRVIMNIPGDANDIKNAQNHLLYESGAGESVIFQRRGATKQVLNPATPSNLP